MNNTEYRKSESQVTIERALLSLRERGLTPSMLKANPEYTSLDKAFSDSLTELILVLLHEQDTHALITSIANAYTSQYYEDKHEYDLLYEAVSLTFLGLYSIIKKSTTKMINGKPVKINNIGRVRIDTLFDKPEFFVYNLRAYIQHNILTDLARSYGASAKHTESATTASDEDNESINKLDSMKYNKNNIESSTDIANSVANKITLEEDMHSLVNAVINRFCDRKPVAGYIYLSIMNGSYNPMTMVTDLKSKDFNQLFHAVLNELETTYNVDLSAYNDTNFSADKYLTSFKSISDESARGRIDRLASQTRGDVQKLHAYEVAKANLHM